MVLGSLNTTVGGTDPQDSNVIGGNGMQGVLIEPGASGNQVLGNQIGLVGPSSSGFYFPAGNGAEGVLIESSGTASNPSSIVYASSKSSAEPSQARAISSRTTDADGVHIEGVGATRNLVEANYIGLAPGGGYVFGDGQPGNLGDGVWIDDAPDNQIGGPSSSDGNVISSNAGNGVNITGADAIGNTVANNIIGLTAAGTAVLGNDQAGVADTAPGTVIGPGNVISANLIGVSISGADGHRCHRDRQPDRHRFDGRGRPGQCRGGRRYRERQRRHHRRQRPGLAGHLGQPGGRRDQRSHRPRETWSRATSSESTRRERPTAATRTRAS